MFESDETDGLVDLSTRNFCQMKLMTKLLPLLMVLCTAFAAPAWAQTGQTPCTVARLNPANPPPPVATLLATHQCLLAHYNPNDPSTDYGMMTWDLGQTGIDQLIAGDDAIPKSQRVLILNNYAFWLLQDVIQGQGNGDDELLRSVRVLKLVLSLAPNRGFAWLNLGDAYRAEMNLGDVPGISQYEAQTPQTQAVEARQAVAAYRHYLMLVQKPSQRVQDYVYFEAKPNPPVASAWNTSDAISNMDRYPVAAEIVLRSDNQQLATLALAMDLALFLPDAAAHKAEVIALLNDIAPQPPGSTIGYDGTAESFVPYLNQTAGDGASDFPLTCGMIAKYPDLLDGTEAVYGGHHDDFIAQVACNDPKYQLPASVTAYEQDIVKLGGSPGSCGSATDDLELETALTNQQADNAVRFADGVRATTIPPTTFPLQVWGETDLSSYTIAKSIGVEFFKARTDLTAYYHSVFGLSPSQAQSVAQGGVWMLGNASNWALGGKPDPLAEALLAHAPLPQVQAALTAENTLSPAILFDAVAYPEALKLLLAQKLDLTVTTPIGKTLLMEAAKYNQLQSVQLLLAAGADVNAASLPPGQINNNGDPNGDCWSLYTITHGSRTALMYAAANANLPIIDALLAAGADTGAKDSTGLTALDYLEGRGPVPKNPNLSTADFKTSAHELALPNPHYVKPTPTPTPASEPAAPAPPPSSPGPPPPQAQPQPNNSPQNLPGQISL
jgi:hypothetical protein